MGKTVYEETLRHREAFDFYYSLGNLRNYPKVAQQFQVSPTSIKKWATSFDWKSRIRERDARLAIEIDKATDKAILEQRQKIVATINSLVDGCLKELPDGTLQPTFLVESVADFERLVKLFLLMHGEPTERSENVDATDAREIILSRLGKITATASENLN